MFFPLQGASVPHFPRRRCRRAPVLLLLAAACHPGGDSAAHAPPPLSPAIRPPDDLLRRPELLALLEARVQEDPSPLRSALADPDPALRARAAFLLAPMRDPEALPLLVPLLGDSVPLVRADAAFALGHLEDPSAGDALIEALEREGDPLVRRRLLEALGRTGWEEGAARLLAFEPRPGESASLHLALARLALRPHPEEIHAALADRLAEGLASEDGATREAAALYFEWEPDAARWTRRLAEVREALDRLAPDDPAAIPLLAALAGRADPTDGERLLGRLTRGGPRIRAAAARALGIVPVIEWPGVREALWRAVGEDSSDLVALAAARSLHAGFRVPGTVVRAAEESLREGLLPWRRQLPLLELVAARGDWSAVVAWLGRYEEHPAAAAAAAAALGLVADPPVNEHLFRLAAHPDRWASGAALAALNRRWERILVTDDEMDRYFRVYAAALRAGTLPGAVHAARALIHPGFAPYEPGAMLREALDRSEGRTRAGGEDRRLPDSGLPPPDGGLSWILRDALVRLEGGTLPSPIRIPPDPDFLRSLRDSPLLLLETEAGTLRIRLNPEEAPLATQALASLARSGALDDVPLHRVVPGILVQGGDRLAGDGTGPAPLLPLEPTWGGFPAGTVGLASPGDGGVGSQFFVLHAPRPELEGRHTVVGWLEGSFHILDALYEGIRVGRARIVNER